MCNGKIAIFGFATLLAAIPTIATARTELSGEASARAVAAKRNVLQNDEFDSSGFGASASLRAKTDVAGFELWAEGSAGIFNYLDEERDARQSLQGEVGISRELGETLEIAVRAVTSKNLVFVEALSADQQRVRVEGKWEQGNNRLQAFGEYRRRQYDDLENVEGTGTRFGGYYNRRLGSYHWVRVSAFTDNIDANSDFRDYDRVSASIDYSRPFSRMFRGLAGVDLRSWGFPGRDARGPSAGGETRKDSAITPQLGAQYGRGRGLFATARAGYEFRTSNDERFDGNTPRFSLEAGYRF